MLLEDGFFASTFPVKDKISKAKNIELSETIGELSESFTFDFQNTGMMTNGYVYTIKTEPKYKGKQITLGDIIETEEVSEEYFVPENDLYYTNPEVTHSDESEKKLSKEERHTWQYIKGAKENSSKIK